MKAFKLVILFGLLIIFSCSVRKEKTETCKISTFKILCYNIHHANPPSRLGVIDLDAIAGVINNSRADIVALQEVDNNTRRSGNIDQAKVLAEKTGMNYHFFKGIDYDGGDYGVAILSKHELKDVKIFPLPQKILAEKRVLSQVTVQVAKQKIIFANTHLDATKNPENRNIQMQYIMDLYKDTKLPVILCGDLNSTPTSDAIKLLDQQFKRTCFENCPGTIPQINPTRTIDYIATKNIAWPLINYQVIEETYASDHRPIMSSFNIK